MSIRVSAILAVATLLSAPGCGGNDLAGCTKDTECPSGHVCLSRRCEQICREDRDCTAGRVCDGEICVAGNGSAPSITGVSGKGSNDCVGRTLNPCIGPALVVTGSNLSGSTFHLQSPTSGAQVALGVPQNGRQQNDLVDLAPTGATPLVAGDYVLVAVNSAGTDQAGVSLLQGEAGPDATGAEIVARINASTAVIDADNLPGGSGGGATRYSYDNSTTAVTSAFAGDRMVVALDASTTQVQSLAIDNTRLHALCADADGCQVSLGTIGFHYDGQAGLTIQAPYVNMPCRFFIVANAGPSSSDAWAVSSACMQWYAKWKDTNADGAPDTIANGVTEQYIPFYSGAFGGDGYAGTGDPPDDTTAVLHNRACYFAESAPNTTLNNSRLQNDAAKGFYLVASYPAWAGGYWIGDAYWPPASTGRGCLLVIED